MAEIEPMRGRRAAHRSCSIHGDNGCEIQGEAGPRTRAQEKLVNEKEAVESIAHSLGDDAGFLDGVRALVVDTRVGKFPKKSDLDEVFDD